jgi:hypothetical protein
MAKANRNTEMAKPISDSHTAIGALSPQANNAASTATIKNAKLQFNIGRPLKFRGLNRVQKHVPDFDRARRSLDPFYDGHRKFFRDWKCTRVL